VRGKKLWQDIPGIFNGDLSETRKAHRKRRAAIVARTLACFTVTKRDYHYHLHPSVDIPVGNYSDRERGLEPESIEQPKVN
jgi:hypothetical protein